MKNATRIAVVTGATGFVGGRLCERLRQEGWTVHAVVRGSSRTDHLVDMGCGLVGCGIGWDAVRPLGAVVDGADAVFHLAGLTRTVRPRQFIEVNAEGARVVARAAARVDFGGRFVLLSSLAAAGPAVDGRPRRESDGCRPVSFYGHSKLLGERGARAELGPRPIAILRPGAIYGPHEHQIYEIVKAIHRTGVGVGTGPDVRVQMTHVHDVVDALVACVDVPRMPRGAFMINDRAEYQMSEVMGMIGEALGRRVRTVQLPAAAGWAAAGALDFAGRVAGKPLSPFGEDKMREICAGAWLADPGRFESRTGWRARRGLGDGLRDTVAWYRRNGWL